MKNLFFQYKASTSSYNYFREKTRNHIHVYIQILETKVHAISQNNTFSNGNTVSHRKTFLPTVQMNPQQTLKCDGLKAIAHNE